MKPAAFPLMPAGAAFDAIADRFDERFGGWLSVAAQRRQVREALIAAFPQGSRLLEIGGGTGLDAEWLAQRGRSVLVTDASPAMVRAAKARLGEDAAEVVPAEHLSMLTESGEQFDGAYSNFAALNCVSDLRPVAEALAALTPPGGSVVLVVFGCFCPGEMLTEFVRRRFKNVFRRWRRGDVEASLSGNRFTVRYHRRRDLTSAMSPWFSPTQTSAIGLFVPPSAAEPWISSRPRLLGLMEAADRLLSRPLWAFGDHVLYRFTRSERDG